MSKRHRDALLIQEGACNPSGITYSLLEAIKECKSGGPEWVDARTDPAVQLILHQLAFVCKLVCNIPDTADGKDGWDAAMEHCRAQNKE